jgi:hypothetical protein
MASSPRAKITFDEADESSSPKQNLTTGGSFRTFGGSGTGSFRHEPHDLRNRAKTVESEVTEAIQSHYTDEHEHKPTLFSSLIVAHPRSCCMFWCCFYFLFTLFLTIVLAAAGLDPMPTDRISEGDLCSNSYYM